jgi:hypothetical protein
MRGFFVAGFLDFIVLIQHLVANKKLQFFASFFGGRRARLRQAHM